MSQIELVTGLPDWRWTEHSANEIAMTGMQLVEASDFVWKIGQVAIAGFVHRTLLGPPWMWFVLADNITIADLIDFRRLSLLIQKGTMTAVQADHAVSVKFAKVYGFEETGDEQEHFGRIYKLMRKV